jgi:endonuclease YncB( thermonuclease family)
VATGIRRFRQHRWRRWRIPLLLAALLALRLGYDWWHVGEDRQADTVLPEGLYQVVRVIDGDTLVVRAPSEDLTENIPGGGFHLRLLGVDCPESVRPQHPVEPWALEASAFTRDFVSGHAVRLRFDRRRVDKYQRRLAYVFVADKMLNEELLRAGLARVMILPGDSETVARRLRAAQSEARQHTRGIWSNARP